jgi:hypothetical protein
MPWQSYCNVKEMKKILFLHDPLSALPATLLSSVVNLASADDSFVKVLLLGRLYFYADTPYYGQPSISLTEPPSTILPAIEIQKTDMEQAERQQLKEDLLLLETRFKKAGIKYSFSEEVSTLAEILTHSAYADLIIADALINVPGPVHLSLNVSIKELLVDAHCPVVLLREGDMPPDRIVLSYDGSYSSMYSIRSFSYLFPNLRYVPTFIVYISPKEQKEPRDLHHIKDWLPLHFDDATVEVLPGEPADVLPAVANKFSDSTLVVMGAYGRSALSRLFRESLANSILQKANASLFLTHER